MNRILIIFAITICSCKQSDSTSTITNIDGSNQLSYEQKRKIIIDGNIEVYNEYKYSNAFSNDENVVFYSLILAHKHNHPQAYLDVYELTKAVYMNLGLVLDSAMREFTKPYLLKAASLGNERAIEILEGDATSK